MKKLILSWFIIITILGTVGCSDTNYDFPSGFYSGTNKFNSINFDFTVNEWDENLVITQITEKEQFTDYENEIFEDCTSYVIKNVEAPLSAKEMNVSCDYNRNSGAFVLMFRVQNLGVDIEEFFASDNYKELVSYGLHWLDSVDNSEIYEKGMTILYETPTLSGDKYYDGIAFDLVENTVSYTVNYVIESKSLSEFVKAFDINYKMPTNAFVSDRKLFIDFDTKRLTNIYDLPKVNNIYRGTPNRWTAVDIDDDGEEETIVEYMGMGDTVILDRQGNDYYAYYMPYRGIKGLKADGTSGWSNSASESGVHRLSFSSEGIITTNIILYDSLNNVFMIDGYYVSEEECSAALSEQYSKEDVVWYEIY